MNPLTQLLIAEGPALVSFVAGLFRKANPEAPAPVRLPAAWVSTRPRRTRRALPPLHKPEATSNRC